MPTPFAQTKEHDEAFAQTLRARIAEIEADASLDADTKARMLSSRKSALAACEGRLSKPSTTKK